MYRSPIYVFALLLCIDLHAQIMPFKNYGVKDGLNDNNVQAVIRDDRGLLWVGTDFGIYWFDGKRFYQPQIKTNIGQLYVTGFYKDRSGAIWTLTFFNGIYKYQNGRFTNYLVDTLLKNATTNSVTAMIQVSDDKCVVISQDCAYLFDGKRFSLFDPGNAALRSKTNAVTQLPDETILLSADNGAFLYRYDHGKFVLTDHVLKDKQITKILVTKKQFWVLAGNGVLSFENKGIRSFSSAGTNYLPGKKIRDITADMAGAIWTVTDNGTIWALTDTVFKIKNGKTTRYVAGNGLPEKVQQIYCDNEGLVWFANRKGISMLADEYYEFNIIKNRSNDEPVTSLITDRHNNFWIGTVNGIALKKDSGYFFYRELGSQLLGYIAWLHKNKNGDLWAGTNVGVIQTAGSSIKKNSISRQRQLGKTSRAIPGLAASPAIYGYLTGIS